MSAAWLRAGSAVAMDAVLFLDLKRATAVLTRSRRWAKSAPSLMPPLVSWTPLVSFQLFVRLFNVLVILATKLWYVLRKDTYVVLCIAEPFTQSECRY